MPATFELHVNGRSMRVDADADRSLLSILRHDLELSGTKYGCGEGECGACTVLIDGVPTRSCVTTAAEVAGKKIETIESLEQDGKLHERVLKQYDAILNPPGIPHYFRNDGDRDARFNIMVGAARPQPPVYTEPKIEALRAERRQEEAAPKS